MSQPNLLPNAQPLEVPRTFGDLLSRLTRRVFVTPLLIVANAAVFGLMVWSGIDWWWPQGQHLLDWGANYGPYTLTGQWWRLVTSMFLHFGVLHLAANMWGLYVLGPLVERLVGNIGFVILYLLCGAAGSIASLYSNPAGSISAGASGAIFGILGALVGFMVPRYSSLPPRLFFSLLGNALVVVGLNIWLSFQFPQIDNAAHFGGLGAGVACGLLLSRPLWPPDRRIRVRRNLIVAAIGAAALFLSYDLLPKGHIRFEREFERFVDTQIDLLQRYQDLEERKELTAITAEQFADRLEKEVLEPWRAARKRLETPQSLDPPVETFRGEVVQAARAREEAIGLRIRGMRENDADLLRQARQKRQLADRLVEQINRKNR